MWLTRRLEVNPICPPRGEEATHRCSTNQVGAWRRITAALRRIWRLRARSGTKGVLDDGVQLPVEQIWRGRKTGKAEIDRSVIESGGPVIELRRMVVSWDWPSSGGDGG